MTTTMTKVCTGCKEEVPLSDFHKDKHSSDGRCYRCKDCKKKYYLENKSEFAERDSKRYKENREEILRKQKSFYSIEKNMKRKKKYQKRWKKENVEKVRSIARRYQNKKRALDGEYTEEEWQSLLDKHNHRCAACGISSYQLILTDEGIGLTADHIVPVSKGGTNFIDNIQPLCKPCNSSKHNKIIDYGVWNA